MSSQQLSRLRPYGNTTSGVSWLARRVIGSPAAACQSATGVRRRVTRRLTALLLPIVLLCQGGAATANPVQDFVTRDGFTATDVETVWQTLQNAMPHPPTESVLLPTHDLGPIPLALLTLTAIEPKLDRVRYRIRYGVDPVVLPPGAATVPRSFLEITRFNLGPAIRASLVEALGAEQVAEPAAFGEGPDVAWRLVTQPLRGNRAVLLAAGRQLPPASATTQASCLGAPCTSAESVIDASAPWGELQPIAEDTSPPAGVPAELNDLPLTLLASALGEVDSLESEGPPTTGRIPEWSIEIVIEQNLGQDDGVEMAYRWSHLLDDSVAAIWHRLAAFRADASPLGFEARVYECARGPRFAKPDQYCP